MRLATILIAVISNTALAATVGNRQGRATLDQRGHFPPGTTQAYLSQCIEVDIEQDTEPEAAKKFCECGVRVIEQHFTDSEIEELDTADDGIDPRLAQKALVLISRNCKLY